MSRGGSEERVILQRATRRGLRTKQHIYIFGVLPHLESTTLGRVQDQEAFQEVLAVRGHIERNAVLSS